MARDLDDRIVRRSNGSIDIDFYVRRSTEIRRKSVAAAPGAFRGWLARGLARAVAGLRKLGPASPGRDITVR